MTTETVLTTAEPDGTFQATLNSEPVRVKDGTGWSDIALALTQVSADGEQRLAPQKALADVTLARGGSSLMAVVGNRGGAAVEQEWPFGTLPEPTVDGDTATYSQVLPGVDLVQVATATGVSQVLKVYTEAAAADPRVAQIHFWLDAVNATVEDAGAGKGLEAVDASGNQVLQASEGQWWDSSWDGATAKGPGGPGLTYPVDLTLGQENGHQTQNLGLASLQNAKKVTYPVYIDPDWSVSRNAYLYVDSAFPTTSYWNGQYTDSSVHVGYLPAAWDTTYGYNHVTRGFYQFDTSPLAGKTILAAKMDATEVWSSSCTATPVSAWLTDGIGTGTTWNAQPGLISKTNTQTVAKGNSASCPAGTVGFDMGSSMGRLSTSPQWTIGLRADNESDSLGWKRFDNNASMVVTYDTPPNTPQINWVQNANWVGTPWAAGSKYTTRISNPVYDVWASDPDGTVGGQITVTMTVTTTAGATLFSGTTAPGPANNTYQDFTWQGGSLADGDYILKAYTTDAQGIRSTGTMSFGFSVDTTAPPPPVITSQTPSAPPAWYTNKDDPSGAPGQAYGFTLQAGSISGTQGFIYSVMGGTSADVTYPTDSISCGFRVKEYIAVCPSSRTGSVNITIGAVADNTTLTVWAFDTSGNVSHQLQSQQPVSFTLKVDKQNDLPTTSTPLTASGAAVWQNIQTDPTAGPAANGCTGSIATADEDPFSVYGTALELTGSGDRATTAAGMVDASKAFSTSAWVCPKATTTLQAVLTQMAGPGAPAAQLGVAADGTAVLTGWTSATAADQAPTNTALPAGQWTFVSAEYDPLNQQMRITMNGTNAIQTWVIATASAQHVASGTASTQPVVVGDSGTAGASQFIGQVYHPVLFQGILLDRQFKGAYTTFANTPTNEYGVL